MFDINCAILPGATRSPFLNNGRVRSVHTIPSHADVLFSLKNEEAFRRAHRERIAVEAAPKTFYSKLVEATGVSSDVVAIAGNGLVAGTLLRQTGDVVKAADPAARVAAVVGGLGIAGGAMGVFTGINTMCNAAVQLPNDFQKGNWEGGFDHGSRGLVGTTYTTLSSATVASNAAIFAGAGGAAAAAATAATACGFAMYGVIGIWSGYGLSANIAFRSQLNQKLKSGQNAAQLLSTMRWLASEVRGGSNRSHLHKKWDRFAFRTSDACCRLVRSRITLDLIRSIEAKDHAAMQEARLIIDEVKRANAKQLVKHSVYMAIALLGIVASICGLVFATGVFAPLLFGLGALLWLLVDSARLNDKLGDLICGKSKISPAIICEEEKNSLMMQSWMKQSPIFSITSGVKRAFPPIPSKLTGGIC